jgi:pimeloyl-ACP methyl ester carboxylesterase
VAVVLPGARYLPFAPLLWFAREVAMSYGWSALEVWDEYRDPTEDPGHWVRARAEAALERAGDAQILLVTKSITSHAVRIAAERNVPGIWLTPLIAVDDDLAADFARLQAPALLIAGTADESWDGEAARQAGHQVLELEGANHALEVEGHPLESIDFLRTVAVRIDLFVAALEPTPSG